MIWIGFKGKLSEDQNPPTDIQLVIKTVVISACSLSIL